MDSNKLALANEYEQTIKGLRECLLRLPAEGVEVIVEEVTIKIRYPNSNWYNPKLLPELLPINFIRDYRLRVLLMLSAYEQKLADL